MTDKVAVVLSVYNGERYLPAQIESIISQEDVSVSIFIRDDGSTDRTWEIIQNFSSENDNIKAITGANVGIRDSFLSALAICPFEAEYYSFADADDVWLPRKLTVAVGKLKSLDSEVPAVYCSQTISVDENLNPVGPGPPLYRKPSLENALVECRLSGATGVFNKATYALLRDADFSNAVMHDAWVYLVVTAFGHVLYDEQSYILYRQHGQNQIGGRHGLKRTWLRRSRRARDVQLYLRQAESFLSQCGSKLQPEQRVLVERFVGHRNSFRERVRYALSPSVRYQRHRSDILFRALVILGLT